MSPNDPNASLIVACLPVVGSVGLLDRFGGKKNTSFDQRYRGRRPCTWWWSENSGGHGDATKRSTILRAIDGSALVMAAVLLGTKYLRAGNDVVAGGFLVLPSARVSFCFRPRRGPCG